MEKQSLRDSCRIIKRLDLLFSKTFSERRRKKKTNKIDMLNYTDQRTDNKINLTAKYFGLLMEAGEYLGGKGMDQGKEKGSFHLCSQGDSISIFRNGKAELACLVT